MLNHEGELLSAAESQEILDIKEKSEYIFADIDSLGTETKSYNHTKDHIQKILDLELVDVNLIKSRKYKICVDAINSVGSIAVPMLLEKLGVKIIGLNFQCNGDFQHEPEPLEKNLGELESLVIKTESHLDIAVDPDVDRLVFINERGEMINEEYTIVMIADYVLSQTPGNTVSNLSSSRALVDITKKYNKKYFASAVGEKNVVNKMKEINAVIGGEGSGGVIYPKLHYGRDALVGIALFLSSMVQSNKSVSEIRLQYPNYYMVKEKITLPNQDQIQLILDTLAGEHKHGLITLTDGLKIDFKDSWVHIRASNTEPILRVYTESQNKKDACDLAQNFITNITMIVTAS
jgi:phosphomannomutase